MKVKNARTPEVKILEKSTAGARLWKALQRYRRMLVLIFVVVLLGSFGIAGWHSYRNWVGHEAMKLVENAKNDSDYQIVIQKYPSTAAAILAMVNLGDTYWEKGEFAKARATYERFLEIHPDHVFSPFVRNMRGECLFQENRLAEAKVTFEAILNDSKASYIHDRARENLKRI